MTRGGLRSCSAAALVLFGVHPALALTVSASGATPSEVGQPASLHVEASGQGTLSVAWSFGDGEQAAAAAGALQVSHVYAAPGHYPVIATVKDDASTRAVSFLQTVHWPLDATAPAASSTIAYDAARGLVYVANPDADSVTLLDARGLAVVAEIPTLKKPRSLALAPDGRLWVSHQDDFAIAVVNPDLRAVVGVIPLPYASQPVGLVMSPRGDAAYVALRAVDKIAKLDPSSRTLLELVDAGPSPHAVAVSGDGERVFATRFFSPADRGELFLVSADPFEVGGTLRLAADPGPDTDTSGAGIPNFVASVVLSPDGRNAWVAAKKDNTGRGLYVSNEVPTPENSVRSLIARIDVKGGAEDAAARLDLDNRNLPGAMAVSPLGDYLFVTALGNNLVEVLDAYSMQPVAVIDTRAGPLGLVLSPDGTLYVHDFLSRVVEAFDARSILDASDFVAPKLGEVETVAAEPLDADVLLGKRVFYDSRDPRMSRQGYLSCATCHLDGFEDRRVFDFTDRGEGLRNTTSLLGKRGTGQGRLHWTANFDELQDFENPIRANFGGTGFLSDAAFEKGTRSDPLGDPKAGLSPELDALAAYVASLDHVNPSPFRRDDGSNTDAALGGKQLFADLGCNVCHSGPDYTDSAKGLLHDVGTLTAASGQRIGAPLTGLDTPTLLGVWETAPYLHDGSAATLRDVLVTRNPDDLHGVTSTLTAAELEQLEAFLRELDSERSVRVLPEDFPDDVSPRAEPERVEAVGCACRDGAAGGRATRPSALGAAVLLLSLRRRNRRFLRGA